MHHFKALAGFCCLLTQVSGGITYHINQNPAACQEVHLRRLTPQRLGDLRKDYGSLYYCRPDLRVNDENEVYLTISCQTPGDSLAWVPSKEKYSVDMRLPNRVRRIDEQAWQLARPLWWSGHGGGIPPTHPTDRGVAYKGRVFEKSGPRWSGVGAGPIDAPLSQNATRIAVNSWDGLDITYSFLDPTSFGKRDKVKGQFWVDIYDTDSVQRMIQIEGSFKGTGPFGFQWDGTWFGSRYYVLPLGKTNYFGPGLHRLLVCDTGSGAGGQSEKVLRERERTLPVQTGPPVPIAELVSFTDAPVSDPSNGQIREVRVTASVNVRWDGQYRLFLRLSGPDGKYIWENVVAKLASGPGQLTVRFPASQVAALGVDGPYTIERATLTIDSAGNALAAYKHLAGTTQAYRLSSLNRGGP